jgi:hypothetical protein
LSQHKDSIIGAEKPFASLDAESGQLRDARGESIEQPLTTSQRATVFADRESTADYGCFQANIILLGYDRAKELYEKFKL